MLHVESEAINKECDEQLEVELKKSQNVKPSVELWIGYDNDVDEKEEEIEQVHPENSDFDSSFEKIVYSARKQYDQES